MTNQSEVLAITSNLIKAWEKLSIKGEIIIGFDFASHWLKNWHESFLPVTKHSNRNCILTTFSSHLKTATKGKLFIDCFLVNEPCNRSNGILCRY